MVEAQPAYPATLSVDYPDRDLNRLTTFTEIRWKSKSQSD